MALRKKERQALILELIEERVIDSQEELMQHLEQAGVEVTQATVSRDIKELLIIRRPDSQGRNRYQLMAFDGNTNDDNDRLASLYSDLVQSMQRVEFMIVIKTLPGYGNRLGAALDDEEMDDLLGTLAGHDTIYVTAPSVDAASRLEALFNSWQ
ncbi:transcriptional regulator ArgR [Weissella oryzae SG25]|uniref:Arginine repressor n=1 Tax=Weissella oryzae (strain DSM 25784 / JCM 18191 / LMG 30913 / SG25) TaxID=1329250 RepID=A0A069CSP2_WEIOS|nr:arginine repressor [Weissella oryzae]GAK30499.1 transcriptional regulator ArgR [Weissella oryzae SG25]